LLLFQSLLFWNAPSKRALDGYALAGERFQSLLFWNAPSKSGFFSSFFPFLSVKPAFLTLLKA
jgi:hypothetical protein